HQKKLDTRIKRNIRSFTRVQLDRLLHFKQKGIWGVLFVQTESGTPEIAWNNTGIVITLILLLIPLLFGIALMVIKIRSGLRRHQHLQRNAQVKELAEYLQKLDDPAMEELAARKAAMAYSLKHNELAGDGIPKDERGLIVTASDRFSPPIAAVKKKAQQRPAVDK